MFLKRIELQGFKSFADKTVIQFDQDITGIVGPNGCGKSNVNDAIRWVLGEQSVKSLRSGTNMSDIIFSGSEYRKPVNMARVTLVFDNSTRVFDSDFDEINGEKKNENLKTSPNAEQSDSENTIDSEQQDEPTEEPENSNVEQNADKQRKVVIRTERPPQEVLDNE